jgi:hypothetical protein
MKNLLILIALLSVNIGCKKKKEWNVVRYKVGNVTYYSSGPYTQAIGDGNNIFKEANDMLSFEGYDEESTTQISLTVKTNTGLHSSDSAVPNLQPWLADTKAASIYLYLKTTSANGVHTYENYQTGYQTASYTILQNTPDFIEGTFEGKVLTNPSDPTSAPNTSVVIKDGYFCIPKTK